MHVIYDVSHNIAKMEQHYVDGKPKHLLVHRKVFEHLFYLWFYRNYISCCILIKYMDKRKLRPTKGKNC